MEFGDKELMIGQHLSSFIHVLVKFMPGLIHTCILLVSLRYTLDLQG